MLFGYSDVLAQDKRTSEYGVDKRSNALEVGVEYLKTYGDFGDIYGDPGVGAAVRYRFGISEYKSLIASIGYVRFKGQLVLGGSNPNVDLNTSFIPIKVGLKFRFMKVLYAAGEFGGSIPLGVNGIENVNSLVADEYEIKGPYFNFTPTLGVQIPMKNKSYIDLGIRYEGMTNQSTIFFSGFRAAYAFGIAR